MARIAANEAVEAASVAGAAITLATPILNTSRLRRLLVPRYFLAQAPLHLEPTGRTVLRHAQDLMAKYLCHPLLREVAEVAAVVLERTTTACHFLLAASLQSRLSSDHTNTLWRRCPPFHSKHRNTGIV